MSTSLSIEALQRANPRGKAGFAESVEAAGDAVRARVATAAAGSEPRASFPRGRLMGVVFATLVLAAAAVDCALDHRLPRRRGRNCGGEEGSDVERSICRAIGDCCRSNHPRRRALGRDDHPLERSETSLYAATRLSDAAGPARSCSLSMEPSTASSPAAAGSHRASRRTSIRAAARLPTSTSPPSVRTSGGSRCGGSPAA